ncbi:MAG: DUF4116 domain-containing protein, partial [Candidatus Margulisbacteria bacterium]|nr:DUF4116 domain-containing protein [Candidatus Margulisiibacteriota bacterium]
MQTKQCALPNKIGSPKPPTPPKPSVIWPVTISAAILGACALDNQNNTVNNNEYILLSKEEIIQQLDVDPSLRNNKQLLKPYLIRDPDLLKLVSEDLRNDREFVLELFQAVKASEKLTIWYYAGANLTGDKIFV